MRRLLGGAVIAVAVTALLSSLGGAESAPISWAPKPLRLQGLSTVASVASGTLELHTSHGAVTFWGGVNLGTTIPGHNPGELAIPRTTIRRWLPQMASLGIRFVRVYTIMTPAFYEELRSYNESHQSSPLYLVQGVYLPDESYVDTGTLLDVAVDGPFAQEIADASRAVHGDLTRSPMPGHASGEWTADVSPWVAAWIIGAELDPIGVERTDAVPVERFQGTYFSASADSTSTERWLARHLDGLAAAEAERGTSAPLAFVNWPTTDALVHPLEPNPREDRVSIDPNHVQPTSAWPGGTFASYHVYPYYPDFLRYEPALQVPRDGRSDPYLAYIAGLRSHHAVSDTPLLITEFGVPSSIGSAHYGTNGRDQGAHTEQQAMAMDAEMLRGIKAQGASGAFLFIWADEWFKFTWNTRPRMSVAHAERRALWHDPLTNEQWFGVIAQDPKRSGWSTPYENPQGLVEALSVEHDASYVYLELKFHQALATRLTLGFDVVPGGRALPSTTSDNGTHDVAITIEPRQGKARAYVTSVDDPLRLDGLLSLPGEVFPGWVLQRLAANRAIDAFKTRPAQPPEFVDVGKLVRGSWNPASSRYNSMSTWWLQHDLLQLRIPWSMLLIGDPSSAMAVSPRLGLARPVPVSEIGLTLQSGNITVRMPSIRWEPWNRAEATERMKAGVATLARAWRAVNAEN